MDRSTAERLVAELGAQLDLPALALDAEGLCLLGTGDGDLIPTIGWNARTRTLDLMVCLDRVVPEPSQMAGLLAANFAWTGARGAVFALEPATGALVLQRRCAEGDLPEGLRPALEGLLGLAAAWGARLAAAPHEAGAAAPRPQGAMLRG